MAIEFIGGDAGSSGPIGLVARFLLAAEADDEDAAVALLTENSRHGFDIESIAVDAETVSFDDLVEENGESIVPTIIEDEDGAEEMPFIVREEGGELRIDFDATIARMMGVSMDDAFEELAEAEPAELPKIGRMLAAGIETLADGASPLDAFEDPPGDNEPGQWHVPDAAAASFRDRILDTAFALGAMFRPSFHPERRVWDSDEFSAEGASLVTESHGTEAMGFRRSETVSDTVSGTGGPRAHSVEVVGYGVPGDQELRLLWSEAGEPPELTVYVQTVAPIPAHEEIRDYLATHFGWEDPLG